MHSFIEMAKVLHHRWDTWRRTCFTGLFSRYRIFVSFYKRKL